MRGAGYGLRLPSVLLKLTWPANVDVWREAALRSAFSMPSIDVGGSALSGASLEPAARAVLAMLVAMQRCAGLSVFDAGRVMQAAPSEGGQYRALVFVPHLAGASSGAVMAARWLMEQLNTDEATSTEAFERAAAQVLEKLRVHAPKGKNTQHFLRAAQNLGIPWEHVAATCFQYGWGARSCVMDSSYTEHTSNIGAMLARNKQLAAQVLRRAGLPAPPHAFARNEDQALSIALKLGYPVVVKPADLDGGLGVAAGLRDADAVRRAYAAATVHSRNILVEKHFVGQDYRMLVFRGQLVSAVLRQPGGVTGNGVDSIAALVATVNHRREPNQLASAETGRAMLVLDEEAHFLLAEQHFDLSSVPAQDVFVRLRRAANVAMGGRSIAALANVHPDNRALAEQAAEAFNLDLAGIDLIIPDVAVSWRSSGAAICEVNAQPQFGVSTQQHLHGQILQALVPQGGRIPTVVVVGEHSSTFITLLTETLRSDFAGVGLASAAGAFVDGRQLGASTSVFDAARTLIASKHVHALVVEVADKSVLATGLPVDRFDVLVLASKMEAQSLRAVMAMLSLNSANGVVVSAGHANCRTWAQAAQRDKDQAVVVVGQADKTDAELAVIPGLVRPYEPIHASSQAPTALVQAVVAIVMANETQRTKTAL